MSTNVKLALVIPVLFLLVSCKSAEGLKGYEHAQIASASSAGNYISIETTEHNGYILPREKVSLRLVSTTGKPSVHVFGLINGDDAFRAEIWVSTPDEYNSWLEFISDTDKSPRQKIL